MTAEQSLELIRMLYHPNMEGLGLSNQNTELIIYVEGECGGTYLNC